MYVLDYISVDSLAEIKKSFQIRCKKNILKLNSKIFSEWHALTRPWEEQSHGPFLLHKEEKACWPLSMKCWKDDVHMKSVLWAQGRTTVLGLWPSALCCLTTRVRHIWIIHRPLLLGQPSLLTQAEVQKHIIHIHSVRFVSLDILHNSEQSWGLVQYLLPIGTYPIEWLFFLNLQCLLAYYFIFLNL